MSHAPCAGGLAALAFVVLSFLPNAVTADDLNNFLFAAIRNGDESAVQQ